MRFDELTWTFFGLGKLQPGGGTWAALAMAALMVLGYALGAPVWVWAVAAGVAFGLTIWLTPRAERLYGKHDPRPLVIDEVCGMALAGMAFYGLESWGRWPLVLAGFALFRLFDIWKPPPINWLESLPRGWGVAADDAAAGLIALALGNGACWLWTVYFA